MNLYPDIRQTTQLTEKHKVQRKILSIPHTGTRALSDLLQCHHIHVHYLWPRLDAELRDNVIVMPLRNPKRVWFSWVNRVGTDHEIDLNRFNKQWRKLQQLDRIYDIFYLPVDHSERNEQLELLSDKLGTKIKPGWKRTGHMGGIRGPKPEPEVDWDFIYDLPMIKRFYGSLRL